MLRFFFMIVAALLFLGQDTQPGHAAASIPVDRLICCHIVPSFQLIFWLMWKASIFTYKSDDCSSNNCNLINFGQMQINCLFIKKKRKQILLKIFHLIYYYNCLFLTVVVSLVIHCWNIYLNKLAELRAIFFR